MRYLKKTIIALLFLLYLITPAFSAESALRIIIFPFENVTGDKNYTWVGNSFAETLTVGLTKVSSLTVLERSQINKVVKEQVFNTTGFVNDQNAIEMGKILSANIVVLGSFQIIGEQIKIITRFVDVLTGEVQKGHTAEVTGEIKDLFPLQKQLADTLIQTFNISVSKDESASLSKLINSTSSLPAYEYYIKANDLIYGTGGVTALENALQWLKKSIELDPNFVFAHIGLSETYNFLNQWNFNTPKQEEYKKLCLEHAKKAVELKADLVESHRAMAQAYINLNKEKEAMDEIKTALKIKPDDIESLILYFHITKQEPEASIKELEKYISIDEANPNINLFLANQYFSKAFENPDNFNKAIFYLQKIIDKYPDNHYAHLMLGTVYQVMDKDDIANEYIEKAVKNEPKSFLAQSQAGIMYFKKGDYDNAEKAFKIAMELKPEWVYNQNLLGIIYKQQKKYDQALELFNQAIKIDPAFDQPYWGIFDIYMIQQRYNYAESILLLGIKQSPISLTIYHKLAYFYQTQKKYDSAIETLNKTFEIIELRKQKYNYSKKIFNNLTSESYLMLGNNYKAKNQLDKAIENYNKAKDLTPDVTNIYTALANAYIAKKDMKNTLLNFQKIVELEPENAAAYYNLGNVLMILKQDDKAEAAFLNAIKYKPDFAKAYYNLGVIYWQKGKYKESAKAWEDTLKYEPNHQSAKEWLPKALEQLKKKNP